MGQPGARHEAGRILQSRSPETVRAAAIQSETAVRVDATFPAGSSATDTAKVTLGDGTSDVTSAEVPAPVGGGLLSFTGIDCSGLSDGAVTVSVQVTDPAGNSTSFSGTAATKQ